MPDVTSFSPGNFCWCELVTSDQNAAKSFYTQLFGWTADDQEIGPDQFYTMLQLHGKNVGALYGMSAEQMQRLHSRWNLYVSVMSADESAKKAESLGAKIVMQPFDVMDVGRMATIQDPAGATIMLWQAKQHHGASVIDEPGALCWYELNVHDTEKAKEFYTSLFGWKAGGSAEYVEWINGDKHIGGMMQIKPQWGEVPPSWMAYVMVSNCDETAEKAESLGGKLLTGPDDIPNMGRFAIIKDPQGAVIAIYQTSR